MAHDKSTPGKNVTHDEASQATPSNDEMETEKRKAGYEGDVETLSSISFHNSMYDKNDNDDKEEVYDMDIEDLASSYLPSPTSSSTPSSTPPSSPPMSQEQIYHVEDDYEEAEVIDDEDEEEHMEDIEDVGGSVKQTRWKTKDVGGLSQTGKTRTAGTTRILHTPQIPWTTRLTGMIITI